MVVLQHRNAVDAKFVQAGHDRGPISLDQSREQRLMNGLHQLSRFRRRFDIQTFGAHLLPKVFGKPGHDWHPRRATPSLSTTTTRKPASLQARKPGPSRRSAGRRAPGAGRGRSADSGRTPPVVVTLVQAGIGDHQTRSALPANVQPRLPAPGDTAVVKIVVEHHLRQTAAHLAACGYVEVITVIGLACTTLRSSPRPLIAR